MTTQVPTRESARRSAAIERRGAGAPLLYLHGFLGEGVSSPGISVLAETAGVEIVRPSLPGFGGLDELEGLDDFEDLSFWLADLCDSLGFERCHLAGSCFGGWVAAEYAVRYPHRVESLVLTAPSGIEGDGLGPSEFFGVPFDRMAALLFDDPDQPMARVLQMMGAGGTGVGGDTAKAALPFLRALAAVARFAWNPPFVDPKLRDRLRRVRSRTLVVWGERDAFLPAGLADLWVESLPDARSVVIERCGHYPFMERPQRWAEVVGSFLAEATVGRS